MIKIRDRQITNSMAYSLPGLNNTDRLIFTKRNSNADYIIKLVCRAFDMEADELNRKTRERQVCEARFICMYLIRRYTNLTLKQIANQFGKRVFDHSTVNHGNSRAVEIMNGDERIRTIVKNIEFQLI